MTTKNSTNVSKGVEGDADVWADAKYRLFWNGFGDASVDLAGDGYEVFRPGKFGECDELDITFGLPAEADAGFDED